MWFTVSTVLLLLAVATPVLRAADPPPPRRVLLLLPFESSRPASTELLQGIESGLRKSYPTRVSVFIEFIRAAPPQGADYQERLLEWIAYKYGVQSFDAICPVRPEALVLAEKLRDRLWPSVPIVFGMLKDDYQPGFGPKAGTTGVIMDLGHEDAIRAALRMLPETRHIALLGGSSPRDVEANRQIAGLIRQTAPGIDVIPLMGLSLAEVEKLAFNLPERTLIYQGWFDYDATGRSFTGPELASSLAPKTKSPIFTNLRLPFGSGIVGGPMNSVELGGEEMGKQTALVLGGTPAENLPLVKVPHIKAVDWRALKRWNIPESRVPAGTEIWFRKLSVWEEFRRPIEAVAGAILLQALVIGFLLAERRRRGVSERAARASDELSRAILSSLSGRIAILDKAGTIIRVSDNWGTAWEGGEDCFSHAAAGSNYFETCRGWGSAIEGKTNLVRAVEAVLNGRLKSHVADYHVQLGEQDRWMEARVERLDRPEGGVVVTHTEITQRKRSELERRRTLDELHHMNRVATVGELAGSLAHELAQPLASILSNAQAAMRFADRPEADLLEIREALAEIADDDRRARTIIDRMRSMLKKQAIPVQDLELNQTVEEVSRLVRNVAMMRGIAVRLELAPDGVTVRGDGVSVQQVLLNLLNNGMDAVQGLPKGHRQLTVTTRSQDGLGEILVEDNGPGIPGEVMGRLFESFFTTKKEGLGMGLSICRSIVQTLGGRISVENAAGGGAVFRVSLPLSVSAEPTGSREVRAAHGVTDG